MKFDDLKKLQQKKYRADFGHFLVEGEHLVLELQKAAETQPHWRRSELYVTARHQHWRSPFVTHVISERQMQQLADTRTPQGIVAVAPMPRASTGHRAADPDTSGAGATLGRPISQQPKQLQLEPQRPERAIYLYEIQDPGNLGTALRTLAWFGGFRCLLSPGSVDPYNSKAVRASMGAIFHVPIELDVPLQVLPQRFARIARLDMHGERLPADGFASFDCYLFGNEARGLPREALADIDTQPFTIAGSGTIESLNLASTVSICAYELKRTPAGR